MWAGACTGLLGRVLLSWDQISLPEKDSVTRTQWGRTWYKQVKQTVSIFYCLCWGQLLFFPESVSMNAASQGYSTKRANNLNNLCPWWSSDHCFHIIFPWVFCLPSLQEHRSALWAAFQPKSLIIKSLGFNPCWLQELMNFSFFGFPSNGFGKMSSLSILLCVPLSLFSVTMAPPLLQHRHFLPKPGFCTSYLLWCCLFSPFSFGLCSASLWVYFWGI